LNDEFSDYSERALYMIGRIEIEAEAALIREQFETMDERERMTRSAVAKIEADFLRRFMEL
jgi:hypothetical protein